jgi:metal-dependent HD superfamily phosphatase/phosphodiesterase
MDDSTKIIATNRVPTAPSNGKAATGTDTATLPPAASSVEAAEQLAHPLIHLRDVRNNDKVRAYIEKANQQMATIGYSEHGLRHAALVAAIARNICLELGYEARIAEIAAIAGYLHDIGNCVHRIYHPQIGATMAFQLLDQMGMDAHEIALIIGAIGNHEEPEGVPINTITAAVIIADKSDVHFTRVQNPDPTTFDIHDRVNNAVQKSRILISEDRKVLTLDLVIDVTKATLMEYFEIFVIRMIMCRKAAEKLVCQFRLIINGVEL